MSTQRPARTTAARLRPPVWLLVLVAGMALALAALAIGNIRATDPLLVATGLAVAAAILIGLRIHKPARQLPWLLLAVSTAITTVAGPFMDTVGIVGLVAATFTMIGSVVGVIGFAALIRGRIPGGDRGALLDAAIGATGLGVLIWAFGLSPYLMEAGQNSVITAAFFYPAIVALAMVVRLWFVHGPAQGATRLIVLDVLAANAIIILDSVGTIGHQQVVGIYLFARFAQLALMAASALHPGIAVETVRQPADLRPIGRGRSVGLAGALLLNPATLALEVAAGRTVDPAPYLIGGVVLGLLVIARLADALGQLSQSLHERESLMEMLRRQAQYDPLTELPNRSLFNDRLADDYGNRSETRLFAVLLVDVDNFKSVNDSYGHETGDALLVAIGKRLRLAIRDGDTAARMGGDEFVLALPNCADPTVPVRVAQRILTALAEPYDLAGRTFTTSVSIGVAVAGQDDRTADQLVRDADIAMYLAKSRGKGRLEVFEASMQVAAMTQLQMRTDLAAGIAAGDLRLHYQPVVDLGSGRTIGYEALVLWLHNGRLIAAGDFIPVAETSGLIGPLTDWVIDEACRTTASWGRTGARPWVSVNVSSSQLLRRDIVARIGQTLKRTGLSPDRLVVEITESSLLEIDVARPAIERFSALGIRLAIDDFGTGYSALSYLARLPIDIVKLDRSFVVALENEGPEEAVAAAIIELARRLGLTTIGEGIETAAQLERLIELGCDLGQGFYLGRPADAEDARPTRQPAPNPARERRVVDLVS